LSQTRSLSPIELWLVDLARAGPVLEVEERETPRLASYDRDRLDAIVDLALRRERLSAYVALRIVLERIAGSCVRGRTFVFEHGGKPRLVDISMEFSLSHTDGFALIGANTVGAIGVDVERRRILRLSTQHREALQAAAAGIGNGAPTFGNDDDAVVRAWVRLEAFAKARGTGLARLLAEIGVRRPNTASPGVRPHQIRGMAAQLAAASGLLVFDLALAQDPIGAAAVANCTSTPAVRLFPYDRSGVSAMLQHDRLLLPLTRTEMDRAGTERCGDVSGSRAVDHATVSGQE
jgi:4'-phosphopantetheinyl transferase